MRWGVILSSFVERDGIDVVDDILSIIRKTPKGIYDSVDCLSYVEENECGLLLLFDDNVVRRVPIIYYESESVEAVFRLYNIIDTLISEDCNIFIEEIIPELRYIGIDHLGYQLFDGKGLLYFSGQI